MDVHVELSCAPTLDTRHMVRAELLGDHTHTTRNGTSVHIWKRCGKFLARGRHEGRPFGETLGNTDNEARARLHQLLTELETGSFVRPSESEKRQLSKGNFPRLTLRQLADEFL